MRNRMVATLIMGTVLLSGCVQTIAESRVRSALVDAGLNDSTADCMAERMVDRLSIGQLKKLERVKARPGEKAKGLSVSDYLDRVRRVGDAEVVTVTASSAGLCAIGIG
ncbi:MAG: hypothetical protein WA948_01000 [Pontixanthobacter sp.]